VAGIVLRYADWRTVFFVGILPALVTFWIQRSVPESEMWQKSRVEAPGATSHAQDDQAGFLQIFQPPYVKYTFALLFLNFFGLFAWWGLFTWIPPSLSLPIDQGGRGFSVMGTTSLLVVLNLAGMLPGYLCFAWFADRIGRRSSFILFTAMAAL